MRKRNNNLFILVFMLGLIAYILNRFKDSATLSDWYTVNNFYIMTIPYLVGILVCTYGFFKSGGNSGRYLVLGALLGMFYGELFGVLYANNIWIDEIVTATFTMIDIKTVCIIFWIIIGIVVSQVKQG